MGLERAGTAGNTEQRKLKRWHQSNKQQVQVQGGNNDRKMVKDSTSWSQTTILNYTATYDAARTDSRTPLRVAAKFFNTSARVFPSAVMLWPGHCRGSVTGVREGGAGTAEHMHRLLTTTTTITCTT